MTQNFESLVEAVMADTTARQILKESIALGSLVSLDSEQLLTTYQWLDDYWFTVLGSQLVSLYYLEAGRLRSKSFVASAGGENCKKFLETFNIPELEFSDEVMLAITFEDPEIDVDDVEMYLLTGKRLYSFIQSLR